MHYRFAFIAQSRYFYREMYVFYIKNMHFDLITGKRTIRSKFSFPGVPKMYFWAAARKKKSTFLSRRAPPGGGFFRFWVRGEQKWTKKFFFSQGLRTIAARNVAQKIHLLRGPRAAPRAIFPPTRVGAGPPTSRGGGKFPASPLPEGGTQGPVGTGPSDSTDEPSDGLSVCN